MIWIPLVILLILYFIFWLIMHYESRTLWSGAGLFGICLSTILVVIFYAFEYSSILVNYSLVVYGGLVIGSIAMVCLLFFPIYIIFMFFIEGIKIIKHEGFKLTNTLSLLFALCLLGYLLVWPQSFNSAGVIGRILYVIISFMVVYFLSVLAIYCLSAFLNTFHFIKNRKLDYVVVLGAGIKGERITPLLASRINKGIEIYKKNKGSKLIMSGGQGKGEDIPEGEAMARYAIEQGIDQEQIIIENKSKNTKENILFSFKKMDQEQPRVALVTTSYHVFRALLLSKELGKRCIGFGSSTKWYFTLNAFIREFIGYLSITWKKHACVVAIYSLFVIIINLISIMR